MHEKAPHPPPPRQKLNGRPLITTDGHLTNSTSIISSPWPEYDQENAAESENTLHWVFCCIAFSTPINV